METLNTRIYSIFLIVVFLFAVFLPSTSDARVVRFVVEQTRPLADGVEWEMSGAYERLDGRAYMEVDPNDPLNAVIVNIDKASRKSLEERYKNHEGFVKANRKEARKLVFEGFLLQEDADRYISAAEESDVLR